MIQQPAIHDLAVISDRNTCALLDKQGTVQWYCPQRFDRAAVFSVLLDEKKGGFWSVEAPEQQFVRRAYTSRSSILTTEYTVAGQPFSVTDWMPLKTNFTGICRQFSAAPVPISSTLRLRPDYGLQYAEVELSADQRTAHFSGLNLWLRASHPLRLAAENVVFDMPVGEGSWLVLTDTEGIVDTLTPEFLAATHVSTAEKWEKLAALLVYEGPYQREVEDSIRAIQQLTFQDTGSIIAAATTSLPEVLGGQRNYDYRYVWIRDAGMIIQALTQIDKVGRAEKSFLSFISEALLENHETRLSPFYTVDKAVITDIRELELSGYCRSRPVRVGNGAHDQLQLDASANTLLCAKMIYDLFGERENWPAMVQIADFLAENWEQPDNGIWEEEVRKHYTSSKVYSARGLEFIAQFTDSPEQAARWREAATDIREFVRNNCMTSTGAFAVYAGSEEVDIACALFPAWSYTEAHSPEMLATVAEIEKHFCRENLYWRRLEEFDSRKEGAFLAGSFWMAHYYALAGNTAKSSLILDTALRYQSDLGFFAEEVDVATGEMLGNFPQTFAHSSFICAANGLKLALEGRDSRVY